VNYSCNKTQQRILGAGLLMLGSASSHAWAVDTPARADTDVTAPAGTDGTAPADTSDATPQTLPASSSTPDKPSAPPPGPYARFNQFTTKGFNVPIPGPAAYIDPDPMGLRSALAEKGFGYWGYSLNALTYDVNNHGRTDGRQVYSGQKTSLTSYNYLYLTYDLSRYGISDGQLSMSLANVYTTWVSAGPDMFRVGVLQYYQTLFNKHVEVTVGNLANSFTYVGIYVGGNLASGTFGVNASIPSQVGMSSTFLARPGVNMKFNFGHGFYDMVGVQRSVNPDGAVVEQDRNPTGVSFAGNHVGNLFINELGYRRSAAVDKPDTWVRTGYMKNTSDFSSRKDPGTRDDKNYAAYLLADRQFIPLGDSALTPARGIYSGFSAMYAPAALNSFSRYFEWRLYVKGPFDARPYDMLSFVASRNVFSKYAVRNARLADSQVENESTAVSLSYSGSVARGVTLTGGFSYINHPRPVATDDEQGHGLNVQVGAHIYF
jgi:porin